MSVMTEQQKLQNIADQVLQQAKKLGASSADVVASHTNGFSVDVRMGELETVEHNNDNQIDISVYNGQAIGHAATTDTTTTGITKAIEAAIAIAKLTDSDPANGLADSKLMATKFPDLELYHPWHISVEEATEKLLICEAAALDYDKRITNADGTTLSTHQNFECYANSHGFCGFNHDTRHYVSCSMIAEQGGEMQRDHEYTIARDPKKLTNLKNLAVKTAEKTIAGLNAKAIATQKVPVLFAANLARGLIEHFIHAIRGGNIYRKTSFLTDKLGEQIFPAWFNLQEQPYIIGGNYSASFDEEGVQTEEKYFIENGILQNYVLGSYSARRLSMQSTANAGGVFNLIATTGEDDFQAMLKKLNTGFLVTDVMGQGVNVTTGDYSRGASGFWVENGMIQFPVHEVTIASNLKEMFANIVAVGNDVDTRGNNQVGSILIEQMTVAGD